MSAPTGSQQAAANPAPHAATVAGVPHGAPAQPDADGDTDMDLDDDDPEDITESSDCVYIPSWSHPDWNEKFDFRVMDWRYFKLKRKGDAAALRRPALRPEDDTSNPTDYTRRYGAHPLKELLRERDGRAHSSLTPTDPRFQTVQQSPEDDEYDRSLQSILFGYTTSELAEQGALDPTLRVPSAWPSDLDAPDFELHDLFSRYRWTQNAPPDGRWVGLHDVRWGPALDGVGGEFTAQNQKLWDAMLPALQVASKVIEEGSAHPFWDAMTNIFSYRPVDAAKDGRTEAQRAAQGGVPYISLWLDPDDPRAPEPYPEMANLRAIHGFNDEFARAACMSVLDYTLSWSFACSDGAEDAMTTFWSVPNGSAYIRIRINPVIVWPLLIPEHRTAHERAVSTFYVAAVILHEMAHAVQYAQQILTTKKDEFEGATGITPECIQSLLTLGDQMFGVRDPSSIYVVQPAWRPGSGHSFFTEDDCQGEDGLNFEKAIWGNRINVLPTQPYSSAAVHLKHIPLGTFPWPGAHPQPFEQGKEDDDEPTDDYDRYLMSPQHQSWDEIVAIPMEWCARWFKLSWWRHSHQKYGHQALRLAHDGPTPGGKIMRRWVHDGMYLHMNVIRTTLGPKYFPWLQDIRRQFEARGMYIVSDYLRALMLEAAQKNILQMRFLNDELSWINKQNGMETLAKRVEKRYLAMVAFVDDALNPLTSMKFTTYEDALAGLGKINDVVIVALGDMLELDRAFEQEISYEQNIIATNLLLRQEDRSVLFLHFEKLRQRITDAINLLNGKTITDLVLADAEPDARLTGKWTQALTAKVIEEMEPRPADEPRPDPASLPEEIRFEIKRLSDRLEAVGALRVAFSTHVGLLEANSGVMARFTADGGIDPSPEPAVPRLDAVIRSKRWRLRQIYGPATHRELSRLKGNDPLARHIRAALGFLEPYLAASRIDPWARTALGSG